MGDPVRFIMTTYEKLMGVESPELLEDDDDEEEKDEDDIYNVE